MSKFECSSIYDMYAKLVLSVIISALLGNIVNIRLNSVFLGILVCVACFSLLYSIIKLFHYGNSGITIKDEENKKILCINKEDVIYIVQEIMSLTNMSKDSLGYKSLENDLRERLKYFKRVSDFNLFISRIPIYISSSKYKSVTDSLKAKCVLDERIEKCECLKADYSDGEKSINTLINKWNLLVNELSELHKDFEKWADILVEEETCIKYINSHPPKGYRELVSMPNKSCYLDRTIDACNKEKARYDSIITECSGDNKEIVNFMYAKNLSKKMLSDLSEITGEINPVDEILYK